MTVAPSSTPVPTPVPDDIAAWVAAGRVALAAAARDDEWSAGQRQAVLAELARVERLTVMLRGAVLTAERRAGTWGMHGDRDMAGFVGRQSREGRGAGIAAVAQAATLEALPVVAGALVDGPVTTRHLAAITRATSTSPALAAELATAEGQAAVVELATRLDGAELGKALEQKAASLDPPARQREHDEQRANRSFAFTHTRAGTLFRGQLDSVAGHKLAKAIGALCPRPATDDERSREQRQADALVTMVERTLADERTTPGAVAPVQAIVTFDRETWVALRANGAAGDGDGNEVAAAADLTNRLPGKGSGNDATDDSTGDRDRTPGKGSTTDVLRRLADVPAVVDETGRAWPASEISRALCDCALTRAVIGAKREPLDLGRDSRLFRRQHWLALYAAGVRGCAVDGCGMPLAYCELHHVRWWHEHGGTTSIANCVPYCSFHHHEVHRRDLRVSRRPDGSYEHRHPDGRRYGGGAFGDARTAVAGGDPGHARVPAGGGASRDGRAAARGRCTEADPPSRATKGPPVDLLDFLPA